ncbi:MAG: alpha/beta hydrolase, partial [Acidobacteria bacterium]|nr:alpha/beta hydrolase [Acidobacteriota bacterium]
RGPAPEGAGAQPAPAFAFLEEARAALGPPATGTFAGPGARTSWEAASDPWPEWATLAAVSTSSARLSSRDLSHKGPFEHEESDLAAFPQEQATPHAVGPTQSAMIAPTVETGPVTSAGNSARDPSNGGADFTIEDQPVSVDDSSSSTRRRCTPIGVVRTDYFVDTISTLPHYYGLPAQLDVHQVSPVYRPGHRRCPVQAAILVHGRNIDAVSGFDLRYGDYSLQESMARAGINTFSVNLLGWGLSTRFGLDDPCNASRADQERFLIPNPLKTTCPNPDPFHFTNSQALRDELDDVVNYVRASLGVDKVSLFAWSRGGLVAGPYTYLYPDKVKNLVLLSSTYSFPADPPDPLPQPGPSLELRVRAGIERAWTDQVDNEKCPGEQDPAILDPIWDSIMARDPLGSSWGKGGLLRFPSVDYWGWNPEQHQASLVTVPVLNLTGLRDTTVPPAIATQIYNDLGSDNKVLIRIDCASHFLHWEGSTSPTWSGPHATLQDAVVQWITAETYRGATRGTFQVRSDGSIEGPG